MANMLTAETLYRNAHALGAKGKCAAAMVLLNQAIPRGHLPSFAFKAWFLTDGRKGVTKDHEAAIELVKKGTRLGCPHCQGVLAIYIWCRFGFTRDIKQSPLELARASSDKGSPYGQYMLSILDSTGFSLDIANALRLLQLAVKQNFADAQFKLGDMYRFGRNIEKDESEAFRFYRLAATQGHPSALYKVAECYTKGLGVPKDTTKALKYYFKASYAGFPNALTNRRK
jgi:TPR repeat protein